MPQVGAQNSSTIQWESGDEVESRKQEIDVVEIPQHFDRETIQSASQDGHNSGKQQAQKEARHWSRDRRQEFRHRTIRLVLRHLRDTTEDKQRDLPYGSAQSARDEAVTKFMQQNTCK